MGSLPPCSMSSRTRVQRCLEKRLHRGRIDGMGTNWHPEGLPRRLRRLRKRRRPGQRIRVPVSLPGRRHGERGVDVLATTGAALRRHRRSPARRLRRERVKPLWEGGEKMPTCRCPRISEHLVIFVFRMGGGTSNAANSNVTQPPGHGRRAGRFRDSASRRPGSTMDVVRADPRSSFSSSSSSRGCARGPMRLLLVRASRDRSFRHLFGAIRRAVCCARRKPSHRSTKRRSPRRAQAHSQISIQETENWSDAREVTSGQTSSCRLEASIHGFPRGYSAMPPCGVERPGASFARAIAIA